MRTLLLVSLFCYGACSHGLVDGGDGGGGSGHGDGGMQGGDLGVGLGDGGGQCSSASPMDECHDSSDCDDGNPTTTDTCQLVVGGEFPFGTCLHAGCDGGADCVSQAIDPTCGTGDTTVVYPPFVPLASPDVPAGCATGFQLTDASPTFVYTLAAKTSAGSRALKLDLDIATYTAPDGVQVTGVDGDCKKYTLFDTCHLKTADKAQGAYTDGMSRPSDVAIRQYHLDLRAGTSQLTIDFGRVTSPMYVQILGLCDFTISTPATGSARWFANVP